MKLLTIDDALPCPFCGNETIKQGHKTHSRKTGVFASEIYCPWCWAELRRYAETDKRATHSVVVAWNEQVLEYQNRRTP